MRAAPRQRLQVYGACVLTSFQLAHSFQRAECWNINEKGARREIKGRASMFLIHHKSKLADERSGEDPGEDRMP